MKTEQLERLQSELARWPGVEAKTEHGGAHPRLRIYYAGKERILPYSTTRVDARGILNKVTELRRLLSTLGAVRDR